MTNFRKTKRVIFIIADTLRAQNLGCYGANPSPTPNLDKFARNSVVFKNAYASITKTDPSISSMMTGKYPIHLGLVNHHMNVTKYEEQNLKNAVFLVEILKQHGFYTAAVDWMGRWHKRGFDYYSGRLSKELSKESFAYETFPYLAFLKYIDIFLLRFVKRDLFTRFYYSILPNPRIPYDPAENVIDKAIYLLKKNRDKNLFLYVHLWDAHYPYPLSRGINHFLFDGMEKMYNKQLQYMDSHLGRLFQSVKMQSEDSLIVFTSDHGENFCDYGQPMNHENLHEEVVKVPLIINSNLFNPKKIESLVQHVDLFPTILRHLKINSFESDGENLSPLITQNLKTVRKFVYFEDISSRKIKFRDNIRKRGMRYQNFKYIETILGDKLMKKSISLIEDGRTVAQELFNLAIDPLEKKNVAADNQKMVIWLQKELKTVVSQLESCRLNNIPNLLKKVEFTKRIIKKAIQTYGATKIAIAFKGGKDTTTMMHIIKGIYGEIPFPIFFNDTTLEFKETYQFIKKIVKLWNLDLIVLKHTDEELREYHSTKDPSKKAELSRHMKINAIKQAIKKYNFNGFMLGIRRDENPARRYEKYFSKREDHMRIHPMLDWKEEDIWQYIYNFGVPYNNLYNKGYRSVGEKPFTRKVNIGKSERFGRDQEKEKTMETLRKMGYW